MPITATVPSIVAAEWERFTDGIARLSPSARAEARAKAAQLPPPNQGAKTVSVPGWDDVIHVTPRTPLSPDRTKAHFAALHAQQPSPLTADELAELDRRQKRRAAMASSAQPDYAQAYGQIMTAIDNIQDLMTTIATTGRLALWPTIHALDAIAPGATAADLELIRAAAEREAIRDLAARHAAGELITRLVRAEALGLAREAATRRALLGLGTRVLGRLLPIVGTVLLIADILNLLGWLGGLALPAYELYCTGHLTLGYGPTAAMQWGRFLKLRAEGAASLNPFGRHARVTRRLRAARALPTVGNLLEVAQTTDQIFGVGVSFGGLVGATMESMYALEASARGEPVAINDLGNFAGGAGAALLLGGSVRRSRAAIAAGVALTVADRIRRYNNAQLDDKRKAATVLKQLPIHTNVQHVLTEDEHLAALCAAIAAVDLIAPDLEGVDVDGLVEAAMDGAVLPSAVTNDVTAALLEDGAGGELSATRWPWPGAPRALRASDYVLHTVERTPAALAEFLNARRSSVAGALCGALVNTLNERLWLLVTDDDEALHYELTPPYALAAGLANADRVVNLGGDPAALAAFVGELLDRAGAGEPPFLAPTAYDAIASRHGVHLIRLAPPQ